MEELVGLVDKADMHISTQVMLIQQIIRLIIQQAMVAIPAVPHYHSLVQSLIINQVLLLIMAFSTVQFVVEVHISIRNFMIHIIQLAEIHLLMSEKNGMIVFG